MQVRITVTRTVATSLVSVKRIGEDCHSHTIEESYVAKRPKFLLDTAKAEREKNYGATPVYNAMRGAGSTDGSSRLKPLGGAAPRR